MTPKEFCEKVWAKLELEELAGQEGVLAPSLNKQLRELTRDLLYRDNQVAVECTAMALNYFLTCIPHPSKDGEFSVPLRPMLKDPCAIMTEMVDRLSLCVLYEFPDPYPTFTSWKKMSDDERFDMHVGRYLVRPFIDIEIPMEVDRFTHTFIVSPSGGGKTTLMKEMIAKDIPEVLEGRASLFIMDSQGKAPGSLVGDLCRLQCLQDRLILIDPDLGAPLSLNVFDLPIPANASPRDRRTAQSSAHELITFCLSVMTDKQTTLYNFCVRFMMTMEGATIRTLLELLSTKGLGRFRPMIEQMDDTPRDFFLNQFDTTFKETKNEVAGRLVGMLSDEYFERMFTADRNRFNLYRELAAGKIILIHTDVAMLKRERCEMFGRFFLAQLLHAVEVRQNEIPVYVYIDEAVDYIAEDPNIRVLLNKARKRNVGLTIATQLLGDMSAGVQNSLLNVGTKYAAANETDAKTLAERMRSTPEEIMNVQRWHWLVHTRGLKKPEDILPRKPMDKMPKISERQFEELLARMRRDYCIQPGTRKPPPPEVHEPPPEPPKPPTPGRPQKPIPEDDDGWGHTVQ
jgi:hypothetical protein